MNKELSLILLDRIKEAPYLDRVSGLVQTFERVVESEDSRPVTKKIPVTSFATFRDCEGKTQPQIEMIPNSRYRSVLYFEDNGIGIPVQNRVGFDYTSNIRLVCWLNTKLISGQSNMLMSAQIVNDILGKLIGSYFNVPPFSRIHVKVAHIPSQDKNIFSRYDYDEKTTQYLMPPFEYFAIDFAVNYTIPKICLPDIETNLDSCSILNQLFPCTGWDSEEEEDINPVFFTENDETVEIIWTSQRRCKYGKIPQFQVWVYNQFSGKPEITNVSLRADFPYPDTSKYTYYNAGGAGYITIK